MSQQFLTIDVSSELATLCEAQLRGTWQVPAELVRLAVRLGASEVSIRTRRHGFAFSWSGPLIDEDVLVDLRSALDAERGADDRQRAIAVLEHSGMEGLLWAAGLRGARLRVDCTDRYRRWSFKHRRRRRPSLDRSDLTDAPKTVEIEWRCAGLDRRRALRWLALAVRFVRARVLADGRVAPRGFAGGLYHLRLDEPVPCRLGLTRNGDEPVLWLLRDGVVSARASVPGYPPFEAAVELGGLVPPGASAADMRRAVTPFLSELVDRAVWMMVEVSGRFPEMGATDRERLSLLLLRAARKGLRTREICRLPLVATASGDGVRLSVEEIREMAAQRGRVLAAIEAGDRTAADLVDPQSVLLASSELRHLLTELTAVRFQSPPRRIRRFPRRAADRLRAITDRLRRRARGVLARREVPSALLRPREDALMTAIRSAISPVGARFCEGRGAAGWTGHAVAVPRSHPAIITGADLVAADAAWLYPTLLALDAGLEPPEEQRSRWLESGGSTVVEK